MKATGLALILTLAALVTWAATGRHAYTKFQVVERSTQAVDPDDPLAGTGFYEDESTREQTVLRDEFHLGFLPTPQGLFDKHLLSVSTIVAVVWLAWFLAWWRRRGRRA